MLNHFNISTVLLLLLLFRYEHKLQNKNHITVIGANHTYKILHTIWIHLYQNKTNDSLKFNLI